MEFSYNPHYRPPSPTFGLAHALHIEAGDESAIGTDSQSDSKS
jgi:hypothetical protein